jgi:molybdopterin-synthase adenylyltransferase
LTAASGIDTFDDGQMRNAIWRSHALVPGRPCLVCNGQLDAADIQTDKLGLFDDREYIRGASTGPHPRRQNVAALAASVSASLLSQFVSLTVTPGGIGTPGPLRYALSTHTLEHLDITLKSPCPFEVATATGDRRVPLTGPHAVARKIQEERSARLARPSAARGWEQNGSSEAPPGAVRRQ